MTPALRVVMKTCLKHAEQAPLGERISLYRGLAEFCANPSESAKLHSLANEFERADVRSREFAFHLLNHKPARSPRP